jgi:hypothetical protein
MTTEELQRDLRESLVSRHGHIVGGSDLAALLGFRTSDALRKAISREKLPLRTFTVPGRHGRYALTLEIADWLIAMRQVASLD